MDYKTLNQLSRAFTVQDIMTTTHQLKRADTFGHAKNLFFEYDIVPSPRTGTIRGFFKRDLEQLNSIEPSHILSDATPLFELPQLFCESYFYFVISGNRITGYVHYSDLNKTIAKIPFFALFQSVERRLWENTKHRISEDILCKLFTSGEVDGFLKKRNKALKGNVDIGWTGIFSFPYILKIARFYGLTQLPDEDIKLLKEIRNKVAHSDQNLVAGYKDILPLANAYELFTSLLNGSA
jgi:hypothetical protein